MMVVGDSRPLAVPVRVSFLALACTTWRQSPPSSPSASAPSGREHMRVWRARLARRARRSALRRRAHVAPAAPRDQRESGTERDGARICRRGRVCAWHRPRHLCRATGLRGPVSVADLRSSSPACVLEVRVARRSLDGETCGEQSRGREFPPQCPSPAPRASAQAAGRRFTRSETRCHMSVRLRLPARHASSCKLLWPAASELSCCRLIFRGIGVTNSSKMSRASRGNDASTDRAPRCWGGPRTTPRDGGWCPQAAQQHVDPR